MEAKPTGEPGATALRALAHPLRWQLLEVLEREGQATATDCARALGESVASCAYHLGILGKYGYAERVPGQAGREKPWRLTNRQQSIPAGRKTTPEAQAAVGAFLDHELARLEDRFRRLPAEQLVWRDASGMVGETAWLTAAEMRAAWDGMKAIMLGFAERGEDPSRRPPGSREVRLFGAVTMAPVGDNLPSDLPSDEPSAGGRA
jgi:DNA-binding MarR family transcriptional regulator